MILTFSYQKFLYLSDWNITLSIIFQSIKLLIYHWMLTVFKCILINERATNNNNENREMSTTDQDILFPNFFTFYTISRRKRISYTYQEEFRHKPLLNHFAYNQKAFMIFFEIAYNADLGFLPVIHIKTSILKHFSFK